MRITIEDQKEHGIRNHALSHMNPLSEGEELHGRPICISDVLRDIQIYIQASYRLGANPLSHLRKYFPFFAWKYHKPGQEAELVQIAVDVDYILLAMDADWSCGIVTARQIGMGQPRRICYWQPEYLEARADLHWPVTKLRSNNVRFLSPQSYLDSSATGPRHNRDAELF